MTESPDTIHGRMKEGAHLAGYSLSRSIENLRWLLEDARFEQLSAGYTNVNAFLRDTADAFKLLDIKPEERKQIAELVKELQPEASNRAIGKLVGVTHVQIGRDLGTIQVGTNVPKQNDILPNDGDVIGTYVPDITPPPAIPRDDFDAVRKLRNVQVLTEKREEELTEIRNEIINNDYQPPTGLFDVIVIDPPWPYGTQYNPSGRRSASPYPEMSLEEIREIKLPTKDDCILWLWTTHKFMRHSFYILDSWGFRDVAILTWVKNRIGTGSWLRSRSEFCIMAVKGNPHHELSNQTTVIFGEMREHSRKPDEFYTMVEEVCPGYKIDWFSREKREGWAQYGSETDKFNK